MIKNKQPSFTLDDYLMKISDNGEGKISLSKKLIKIENENITVPTIHNYQELMKYNYNIQQLKTFAKYYRLKISGNKNELLTRIFIYLKLYQKKK